MDRAPVAVVIGAGDATGSAVAKRFAREGFTLCVIRRNVEKLSALVSDIEAAGGVIKPFGCDARVEQEMVELFAHIEKDIGPIEVMVFNIGANVHFSIVDTTERVYRKVWEMGALAGFFDRERSGQSHDSTQERNHYFYWRDGFFAGQQRFFGFC